MIRMNTEFAREMTHPISFARILSPTSLSIRQAKARPQDVFSAVAFHEPLGCPCTGIYKEDGKSNGNFYSMLGL